MTTRNPAHYRDILNHILNESSIPIPNKQQIMMQSRRRRWRQQFSNYKWWQLCYTPPSNQNAKIFKCQLDHQINEKVFLKFFDFAFAYHDNSWWCQNYCQLVFDVDDASNDEFLFFNDQLKQDIEYILTLLGVEVIKFDSSPHIIRNNKCSWLLNHSMKQYLSNIASKHFVPPRHYYE